jgi:tripartite-type tricarboxylate transporter receptor subunit TctC
MGMQTMLRRTAALSIAAAFSILAPSLALSADDYPSRPIHIVVPTAAGSTQDITARLMQHYLEQALKQTIVIDNRAGAATMIGTDAVAKAAPDGYTVLIVPTTFTVNAAVNSQANYDPEKDFEPISVLVTNSELIAVNSQLPVKTLAELIAYAKANPGKLNYGTPGMGSQPHLLIEMLNQRAGGLKMQHVPYRGGGPAALSVARNETQLTMLAYSVIRAHVEAGTIRVIANGSLKRDEALPDVPTIAESGFPGYEGVQWLGLVTTKGTPKNVVAKLNAAVNEALRNKELIKKLEVQGSIPASGTAEEFRDLIAREMKNWKAIAAHAGIKVN